MFAVMKAIYAIAYIEAWKSQDFNGVWTRDLQYRCDALTNWAMKTLTLGAGHLWVLRSLWGVNVKLYMKNVELWMWNQIINCVYRILKKSGLDGVWTRDLQYRGGALTNWAMKPLTLGAGHLWGLRSQWGMIVKFIWNISNIELRIWNQVSYDRRSYERILCNCVYRSLKKWLL